MFTKTVWFPKFFKVSFRFCRRKSGRFEMTWRWVNDGSVHVYISVFGRCFYQDLRVWGLIRTWQNCWWILQFLCMHKDLTVMSALFKMAPKHVRWKVSDLRIALKTSQTFDSSISAIRHESCPFWSVYLPRFLFISSFDMWSCDMQGKQQWDEVWSHLLNGCW